MQKLMFFDANVKIGNTISGPAPGVGELLEEMDRFGIDYALIRHGNLEALGAVGANAAIAAAADCSRLFGVWAILPEQCGELPSGEEFFQLMKQHNIRALTLAPAAHRYEACRLTLGRLLDAATERKIPILLHHLQTNWWAVYDFMAEFPHLHCIVNAGNKWGSDRNIRPLLENYGNLRIETAGYMVPEGLYDLAGKYGAERILYGSGFPNYNHGNGMLQLRHSGLSIRAVELIAGRNLEKMLQEVEL